VTITYQTDATGCPGATVRFGWDGQALTSGSFGRTCSISIACHRLPEAMRWGVTWSTPA
jgi:hypothetical protein